MIDLNFLSAAEAAKLPREMCLRRFPERTQRAQRYRAPSDRLLSLAAGALIASICGAEEDEIVLRKNKKPYLPDGRGYISVAHAGEYALLACSEWELGVDLEPESRSHTPAAERALHPEEREWLRENSGDFIRLWTMKESVMKQCGLGLQLLPSSFSVAPALTGGVIHLNGETLYLHSLLWNGYRTAVCTPRQEETIRIREWTLDELTL